MALAIEIDGKPACYQSLSPDASRQKLAKGAVHSEGPVYIQEDDSVMWSDAHGNRLLY